MRIYIQDYTHDRYYPVLTHENTLVRRLLSQVIPQMVEKRGPDRQIVAYLQKTGEQLVYNQGRFTRAGNRHSPFTLNPWQTLGSAGITENEVLIMCYFIQPGAAGMDLDRRLVNEYEWLKELAGKSDYISIDAVEGDPPRRYRVSLKCKGLALHPQTNKPCLTANHVLDIYLPAGLPGYPNEAPYVTCITPHFHPNISRENNIVCIGIERDWDSSLNIAWLVVHLADIITFRVYGIEKPYDTDAVKWAEENRGRLPLDSRPLLKGEMAAPVADKGGENGEVRFEKPIGLEETAAAAPVNTGNGKPNRAAAGETKKTMQTKPARPVKRKR